MKTSFQGQDTAGEPGSFNIQLSSSTYAWLSFKHNNLSNFWLAIQIIIENEPWSEGTVLLPSGSGNYPKCMEIFH